MVINYNTSKTGAEKLLREIRKAGGEGIIVKGDVSDAKQVKQLVKRTLREYGRIDILVNNAGVLFSQTFLDAPDFVWDRTIAST